MINPVSRDAFADELEKIAGARTWLRNAVNVGWNGTPGAAQRWMGEGAKFNPGMGRAARAAEHAFSLGGLTKHLPVGGKSLATLGMVAPVGSALSREDPSGRGHSRLERLTGAAGNIAGGLVGSGAAMAHPRLAKHPLLAGALGGIGGGLLGERIMTTPWAAARKLRRAARPEDGAWRNQAPGIDHGVAHSPDAVEGQAQLL